MNHIGRRVVCSTHPGQVGTVANMNPLGPGWPRRQESYDIVWDSGECTRRVARAVLEDASLWSFRTDLPRRTEEECRAMFSRWFSTYCEQVVAQRVRPAQLRAQSCAERESSGGPSSGRSVQRGLVEMLRETGLSPTAAGDHLAAPARAPRQVREDARDLLASKFPAVGFALSCERRVLTVTWQDGPLPGATWMLLKDLVDGKSLQQVRVTRAVTEALAQAAVQFALWRAAPRQDQREQLALRVTASAYLDGSLDNLYVDGGPASGLCWGTLVRCVLDRWDDSAAQFRQTRRTQGLAAERAALFPAGDHEAAQHFRGIRGTVLNSMAQMRDAISAARPARERSRG